MPFLDILQKDNIRASLDQLLQKQCSEFFPKPTPSIFTALGNLHPTLPTLVIIWVIILFLIWIAIIYILLTERPNSAEQDMKKCFEDGRKLGQKEGREEALKETGNREEGVEVCEKSGETGEDGDGEKWVKV